jgi:hypothetical protein
MCLLKSGLKQSYTELLPSKLMNIGSHLVPTLMQKIQKLIVQSDHPCPRYKTKLEDLVWRKPNCDTFAHISSYECLFELSFFVLKLCALNKYFYPLEGPGPFTACPGGVIVAFLVGYQ